METDSGLALGLGLTDDGKLTSSSVIFALSWISQPGFVASSSAGLTSDPA